VKFHWTDTLNEPLASIGRDREWSRVEQTADGRWLALTPGNRGDVHWHEVTENGLTERDPLDDAGLPTIREAVRLWLTRGYEVRMLAWRIGRRAVFRVARDDGAQICKIFRKNRRQDRRWSALMNDPRRNWRCPTLLDWQPELHMLTIEECPGQSLNERWLTENGEASDGDRIAEILEWLSCSPPPPGLPSHGSHDEILLLGKRLDSYHRTLRHPSRRAGRTVERVIRALSRERSFPTVLCHRDLHDKQVLLDGNSGGTLIDLDLVAAGPPALDAGNILAHLRLRSLQGAGVPWRGIAERIVRRLVQDRAMAESLPRWTAATLLRLSLIYARRRRSEHLLDELLESTEAALDRGGEWAGIFA